VKAFFGKYRVTVDGVSQEVDLKKAEGKAQIKIASK
jgi:hypothetical protein